MRNIYYDDFQQVRLTVSTLTAHIQGKLNQFSLNKDFKQTVEDESPQNESVFMYNADIICSADLCI